MCKGNYVCQSLRCKTHRGCKTNKEGSKWGWILFNFEFVNTLNQCFTKRKGRNKVSVNSNEARLRCSWGFSSYLPDYVSIDFPSWDGPQETLEQVCLEGAAELRLLLTRIASAWTTTLSFPVLGGWFFLWRKGTRWCITAQKKTPREMGSLTSNALPGVFSITVTVCFLTDRRAGLERAAGQWFISEV